MTLCSKSHISSCKFKCHTSLFKLNPVPLNLNPTVTPPSLNTTVTFFGLSQGS